MATTAPGWYDDGRGSLRWWDGLQWTEHVQTPDAETPTDAQAGASGYIPAAPTLADATHPPILAPEPVAYPPTQPAGYPPAEPVGYPNPNPAAAYAPSTPPGYPGGFPGGVAPAGGFIAATESKKSKLWIVWLVLGVVLLGIVILAAVLIPVMIGQFGGGASPTAVQTPSSVRETPSAGGGVSAGVGQGDDTNSAALVVEMYDEAIRDADCDKYFAITSEAFRIESTVGDCATFVDVADYLISGVDNYTVEITSITTEVDKIVVLTTETFDSWYAADGTPLDVPESVVDEYEYVLVQIDGQWVIDDVHVQ